MAGRFSFSMPEGGSTDRPWFRLGQVDVTTSVFVTILGAVSMVLWAMSPAASARLALIPSRVLEGQAWRIVTWPLANQPTLWTIIGLAIFWYFGREIEGVMGRNRFAWFLVVLTVVPAIVAVVLNVPQAGFRPLQFSVFLLFIAQHPFARFFFGIPGWALGAVFLGLEILQLVGLREGRGVIFLFVTLAIAAMSARSYGMLNDISFIPRLPLPGGERRAPTRPSSRDTARRPSPRPAPRRRGGDAKGVGNVVPGPWDAPTAAADATALQAELDALLDKISAGGMDSLTNDEKRRLNELSKLLR